MLIYTGEDFAVDLDEVTSIEHVDDDAICIRLREGIVNSENYSSEEDRDDEFNKMVKEWKSRKFDTEIAKLNQRTPFPMPATVTYHHTCPQPQIVRQDIHHYHDSYWSPGREYFSHRTGFLNQQNLSSFQGQQGLVGQQGFSEQLQGFENCQVTRGAQ